LDPRRPALVLPSKYQKAEVVAGVEASGVDVTEWLLLDNGL